MEICLLNRFLKVYVTGQVGRVSTQRLKHYRFQYTHSVKSWLAWKCMTIPFYLLYDKFATFLEGGRIWRNFVELEKWLTVKGTEPWNFPSKPHVVFRLTTSFDNTLNEIQSNVLVQSGSKWWKTNNTTGLTIFPNPPFSFVKLIVNHI